MHCSSFYFVKMTFSCVCLCAAGHAWHDAHIEVRGQLLGVSLSLHHVGPTDGTQSSGLVTTTVSPGPSPVVTFQSQRIPKAPAWGWGTMVTRGRSPILLRQAMLSSLLLPSPSAQRDVQLHRKHPCTWKCCFLLVAEYFWYTSHLVHKLMLMN